MATNAIGPARTDDPVGALADDERAMLYARIAELQEQLDEERRERQRIVDQYERLLEAKRREETTESDSVGLLDRLL